MPSDVTPWAIFGAFVAGLVSLVGWGLRLMARGRLIQGVIYDDIRGQRDGWRTAAETAIRAGAESTAHIGRLVSAVEQLTAAQRETTALVQQMLTAQRRQPPSREPVP